MEIDMSRRVLILGIWIVCGLVAIITEEDSSSCLAFGLIFTIFYAIWIGI